MNKDINQIMALINAYKMDGLGNNFVIIDRRKNTLEISKDKIVSIANKKIVPFDQLIILEKEEKNTFPIKHSHLKNNRYSQAGTALGSQPRLD